MANRKKMGYEDESRKQKVESADRRKGRADRSKVERLMDVMFSDEALPAESFDKMRLWLIDPEKEEEKSAALYAKFIEKFKFNPEPVLAPALWPDLARRLGLDETPVPAAYDPLAPAREIEAETETVTGSVSESAAVQGRRKLSFSRIAARVAAVLVPAAVVIGGVWWFAGRDTRSDIVEIVVPAGETRTITLPDGSRVEAEGGTTLSYDGKSFADNRAVTLRGEALFDVEEATGENGAKIPFSVETDDLAVNVLGTIFRMAHVGDDATTAAVSLYEGSVGVTVDAATEAQAESRTETILTPGERLTVDTATGERQTELIPASEMAEHGVMPLLRFEEATLGDLIVALEMNYGRKFDLAEGIDRAGGKYSANFEGVELADVLAMLTRIDLNLSWETAGDGVTVKRK
jgi:ferric-dicitrate binding protein FerR (iron transport regulator)